MKWQAYIIKLAKAPSSQVASIIRAKRGPDNSRWQNKNRYKNNEYDVRKAGVVLCLMNYMFLPM